MMGGRNDLVERLYYWTEDGQHYSSSQPESKKHIQIKRLNFFIGRNNSGKSRFLRGCFVAGKSPKHFTPMQNWFEDTVQQLDEALARHTIEDDTADPSSDLLRENFLYEHIHGGYRYVPDGTFKNVTIKELRESVEDAKNELRSDTEPFNRPLDKEYRYILSLKKIRSICDLSIQSPTETHHFHNVLNKIDDQFQIFKQKILQCDFSGFFYIPILRGLRPVYDKMFEHSEAALLNDSPALYAKRTEIDYFPELRKQREASNPAPRINQHVVTGENLFNELTKALLGESEKRENVRKYEQTLSKYFFDGQTISLIPKIGMDTVHIKIGDDKQFSVTQLGDGLQQVLILTYEAFLKKERCAFFIEEPELHMHAGMLRQLMNFYLNETDHFYFFTTHSNHLVDMVDESSEVMIQKFQKKPKNAENPNGYFQIDQCDRDRDLLAQLGVRPSSVYLSNCTIWVEGITDRLYIHRYMQRYLQDLKDPERGNPALHEKYKRFMPNYHYSFVEYQGAGIVHWNFNEEQETVTTDDQGLDAHAACAAPFLIADGDVDKGNRVKTLTKALLKLPKFNKIELPESHNCYVHKRKKTFFKSRFHRLSCKEIENTLPKLIILKSAETTFSSRLKDKAFDVEALDQSLQRDCFDLPDKGIGYLLDQLLDLPKTEPKTTICFATSSGTIDKKVDFCRNAITAMDKLDNKEWGLTDSAKALCQRIFQHIADQNP